MKTVSKTRSARRRAAIRPRTVLAGVLAAAAVVAAVGALGRDARPPANAGRAAVGGDFHSLAAAPGGLLYAGGHAAVAASADGGRTWRNVVSLEGADAMGWGFLPDRILVGGHPGLHVSEDGGKTFTRRNEGLPATDLHALGAGEGVVYAASPQAGILASTDGGRTWSARSARAGRSFMGRILVGPGDRLVATDMSAGVVESADGGRTWARLGGPARAMWVSRDPADPRRLVASGIDGAQESRNGGTTWSPLTLPGGTSMVEFGSGVLLAGVHGEGTVAVWVSRDGGKTWARP